jgi:hypothetical protein
MKNIKIQIIFTYSIILILSPLGFDVRGDVRAIPSGGGSGSPVDVAGLGLERAAQLHSPIAALALHLVSHCLLRLCSYYKPLFAGFTFEILLFLDS